MATCANCKRHIPANPNRLDEILRCRYCREVICSMACIEEHEDRAHAAEAVLPPDPDEERTD
jgi:hypothetical protein